MTPKFDKFIDRLRSKLVTEMSLSMRPITVDPFKYTEVWDKSKHMSEFIETRKIFGTDFNIHLIQSNDHIRFFVFREEELSFYIEGFLEDDDGISIIMCAKVYSSGVPMEYLYKEFLLEHFKYILSDSLQTRKGFGVYVNLTIDSDVNVSVVDDDTGNLVQDDVSHKDIMKYHGSDPKHINYVFKVTKIKL